MTNISGPVEELEALVEIDRLARLDDGSGIIEPQLVGYLDSLGESAYDMPYLRISGQTLLGEVFTGLGEDERVAEMLHRNIEDSTARLGASEQDALCAWAARVVVIRLLRTIARMEAVELKAVVSKELAAVQPPEQHGVCPVVRMALAMTVDVLAAASLDAHPDDMVRVVLEYADRVDWLDDEELSAYFAELRQIVLQRERDLRFGEPGPARFG